MPKLPSKRFLIALLLVAFLVRFAWVLYSPALPDQDFTAYHLLAVRLASGQGFTGTAGPTAFRPAGYPLLLAAGYFLVGSSFRVGQMLNVVLGTVTVFATYELVRRVFSERAGRLAGVLVALAPSLILYTAVLASENMATPFGLISILLVYQAFAKNQWRYLLPAGVFIGLAALARPGFLYYPAVVFFYAIFSRSSLTRTVKFTAVFSLFLLLAIAPWTIRNYLVFGELIPIATNGGFNLAISFNDEATGEYMGDITERTLGYEYDWQAYRLIGVDWTEPQIDAALSNAAKEFIKEQPVQAILLIPAKLRFFLLDDVSGVFENISRPARATPAWVWSLLRIVAQVYYLAGLAFGVIGVWMGIFQKKYPSGILLLLPILYWCALHGIFLGTDRFHLPILPFIFAFSSLGAWGLWERYSQIARRDKFGKEGA